MASARDSPFRINVLRRRKTACKRVLDRISTLLDSTMVDSAALRTILEKRPGILDASQAVLLRLGESFTLVHDPEVMPEFAFL